MQTFSVLYQAYEIWLLGEPFPTFYDGAGDLVLSALDRSLELAVVIAAPC